LDLKYLDIGQKDLRKIMTTEGWEKFTFGFTLTTKGTKYSKNISSFSLCPPVVNLFEVRGSRFCRIGELRNWWIGELSGSRFWGGQIMNEEYGMGGRFWVLGSTFVHHLRVFKISQPFIEKILVLDTWYFVLSTINHHLLLTIYYLSLTLPLCSLW